MIDSLLGTALVTGGAKRIGREIGFLLAKRGYAVAIHYRDSEKSARATANSIIDAGGRACIVGCDLADEAEVATLMARTEAEIGPVSCLVNNASLFAADSLQTLDMASWTGHMSVNLRAPIFLAKSMVERLPSGRAGTIVNIIDQRVLAPGPDYFSYTLSKLALYEATRTLAQSLAPRIRVNAVAPGPVLKSTHQTAEEFAAEQRSTLLQHGVKSEEIAAAVDYLISATSVTGQLITVDAGQHLAGKVPKVEG